MERQDSLNKPMPMDELNIQSVGGITTRLYKSEADLKDMLDLLVQGRASTNDWHYAHVGELLWNFFMVAIHLDPQQHIRLWHAADGGLVAYAMLGEDPSFDWQVLPGYEWSGIEAQALDWAEILVKRLRARDSKRWGGELGCGARQDNPRRIQFLESHGFCYSGRFAEVNMLRSLSEPVPDLPIPSGCQVRELDLSEIADRAAAERDVWLPWTVGNVTTDDYVQLMHLPGYQRDLEVVTVTPEGVIAAYVTGWIDRAQPHRRFWSGGGTRAVPPAGTDPPGTAGKSAPHAGTWDGASMHFNWDNEHPGSQPV